MAMAEGQVRAAPLDLQHQADRNDIFQILRMYDRVLAETKWMLQIQPDHPWVVTQQLVALAEVGRYQEAIAVANRLFELTSRKLPMPP
jgi:hypothetical protein